MLKRFSSGLSLPTSAAFLTLFVMVSCTNESRTTLFDGHSFEGWEGSTEFFRIEDDAIVAGSKEMNIPLNQFLCTESTYADFDLALDVKFVSPDNNGGIQIRSQRIPEDHEVIGYQSDVGSAGGDLVWGSLYDESRRNRFLAKADSIALVNTLDPLGWNHYRIRCVGNRIQHWINGIEVLEYIETDEDIADEGIICLQIHSGPPSEAWYRNIRLKKVSK